MKDYDILIKEIEKLKKDLPFFYAGKTYLNNNIICFVVGNIKSKNKIILQGAIHAREYITSFLLIKMARFLNNFYFDACIYILPLVNPDGVFLSFKKTNQIKNCYVKNIFKNFKINLSLIKCNARGVDLNTNFDALWGNGKSNILNKPNFQNFVGYFKNSEKEVKALESLTEVLKPSLTISYHSKGEVFYWGFNKSKKYSKKYLNFEKKCLDVIKKTTKYKPIFTKFSSGGYKDWCIENLKIPSFTLEVGCDGLLHPIKYENLKSIFDKNKFLVLNLIKEVF